MPTHWPVPHRLQQYLTGRSIFNRLLFGNTLVIVASAVVGTVLSGHFGHILEEVGIWPILLSLAFGILLSVIVNHGVIRSSLRPLHELREIVDRVQTGRVEAHVRLKVDHGDPDVDQLATAINSMLERLEGRRQQLQAISEYVINVQEDERKRIARRLHDDTAQSLSTLIINLERLEQVLPTDAPELRRRLASARKLATRTLEDLRNVVYGLRPTMLDDLGLASAIHWYARSSLDEAGVQVRFDSLDETTRLPPQVETTLFRIAQEAINNVVRHAHAKSVAISLWRDNGSICLCVEDDGCGFDPAQVSGQALPLRRLGLLGIQERADLVSGEVTVDSAPGRGTRLEVRVPVAQTGGSRDGKNPYPAGRRSYDSA
ncbi:MAG TPA: histidine kinase [Anaerolineae bacterium]|nr:histidine kinase [Anaerolineae bacterium]